MKQAIINEAMRKAEFLNNMGATPEEILFEIRQYLSKSGLKENEINQIIKMILTEGF